MIGMLSRLNHVLWTILEDLLWRNTQCFDASGNEIFYGTVVTDLAVCLVSSQRSVKSLHVKCHFSEAIRCRNALHVKRHLSKAKMSTAVHHWMQRFVQNRSMHSDQMEFPISVTIYLNEGNNGGIFIQTKETMVVYLSLK